MISGSLLQDIADDFAIAKKDPHPAANLSKGDQMLRDTIRVGLF